jgi:hypothetical protein
MMKSISVINAKLGSVNIEASSNPRILVFSLDMPGRLDGPSLADTMLLHIKLHEILANTIFPNSLIMDT